MEFSGRLTSFPIGDILQWAHNDRRNGALVVRRSSCEKRLYFRDGDIVAALSDDAAEFFGQHLLVNGLIREEALIRALTHCQAKGVMLGRALDQLGILPAEQVYEALRRHVEDQVCDVFLWRSGIFYFTAEMPREEQMLPDALPAVALAMEGSRWADIYAQIRRLFVHDNVEVARGRVVPDDPSVLELKILSALDDRMSVGELYNEVRGSHFRFLEAAYRLAATEAIDIVAVGDHADSGSSELRLADLLIEQVTEEQAVFLRHHLAIPYDAIEGCVPIWVRPPDAAADERDDLREFEAALDGETELRSLLAGLPAEERARRMDRVVLRLRQGALALLPVALSELEGGGEASAERDRWWRRLVPNRPKR
ncbi:MAG: DUF4388 domain-containing protein [Acidobacteria bacterium]|nr:DUF4388 domain-containing protein [Acidobacteriota bacterium]